MDCNIILYLSSSASVTINSVERLNKTQIVYRSHIAATSLKNCQAFFNFKNQIYAQENKKIVKCDFGIYKNVKVLSVYVSQHSLQHVADNVEQFIYNQKVQLKLHKKYLKFLNPEEFIEKKRVSNEKEKVRDNKRKAARSEYFKEKIKVLQEKRQKPSMIEKEVKLPRERLQMLSTIKRLFRLLQERMKKLSMIEREVTLQKERLQMLSTLKKLIRLFREKLVKLSMIEREIKLLQEKLPKLIMKILKKEKSTEN